MYGFWWNIKENDEEFNLMQYIEYIKNIIQFMFMSGKEVFLKFWMIDVI